MGRCGGDRGIKNWPLLCNAARSPSNTVAVQLSTAALAATPDWIRSPESLIGPARHRRVGQLPSLASGFPRPSGNDGLDFFAAPTVTAAPQLPHHRHTRGTPTVFPSPRPRYAHRHTLGLPHRRAAPHRHARGLFSGRRVVGVVWRRRIRTSTRLLG